MRCYVVDLHDIKKQAGRKLLSKKMVVRVAGVSLVLLAGIPDVSHAAAVTGIDAGANRIYMKLLNVGKWVIVSKGAVDTIQHAVQGDLVSAKKNFLGYMLVYAILWGLPWGMQQIDSLFSEMDVS